MTSMVYRVKHVDVCGTLRRQSVIGSSHRQVLDWCLDVFGEPRLLSVRALTAVRERNHFINHGNTHGRRPWATRHS